MGDDRETLRVTPHETVEVVASAPAALELDAVWGTGGTPPPPHRHPTQGESFELTEGRLETRIGGAERGYGAGESFEIPRGTDHAMWNAGSVPARGRWRISPAGRTLEWFRALDRIQRDGLTGRDGMAGPLLMCALIDEYDDVFELRMLPGPLNGLLVGALAPLGRLRGHRPRELAAR